MASSSSSDLSSSATPETPDKKFTASGKKRLDFGQSPPFKSPTSPSSGKKQQWFGYLLMVTDVKKGRRTQKEYYNLQLQTADGVKEAVGYNTATHAMLQHYYNTGSRMAIDFKVSPYDSSLVFGDQCFVKPARFDEVPFELDISLKNELKEKAASHVITVSELMKLDPHRNKKLFTLNVMITIGDGDADEMDTSFGKAKVKNDIIAEDKTGYVYMRLFENTLLQITSGKTYEITHLHFKQYHSRTYVHTSRESRISEKCSFDKFVSKAQQLFSSGRRVLKIPDFITVRNVDVFFVCRSCKGKVRPILENDEYLSCECGSTSKKHYLEKDLSCRVEFLENDTFKWGALFKSSVADILEADFLKNCSTSDLTARILALNDIEITIDSDDKIHMIKNAAA